MLKTYTANDTRIASGYLSRLVEWPEVVTDGKNLEQCRALLRDAHWEIAAYGRQGQEAPPRGARIDTLPK
jgi:hypothetical protein